MLYPYWSLQAYLSADGTRFSHLGLAKTSELYFWIAQQFAQKDPDDPRDPLKSNYSHQRERFLIVPWEMYQASGNYLFLYPAIISEPASHPGEHRENG